MSDFTGNTASACPWCGDNHGPQWQCSHDMLRQAIGYLRAENDQLRTARQDRLELAWDEIERLRARVADLEMLRDLAAPMWKYDSGTVSTTKRLDEAARAAGGEDD